MVPYLQDGCTRVDFSHATDETSIYGTAEVFSKQLGCNMNYLLFGPSPENAKNIGGNISFRKNDFGFKREFFFNSNQSPLYDCTNELNNDKLDMKGKKRLMKKMNKSEKNNSLFIKIFASDIAEGGYSS